MNAIDAHAITEVNNGAVASAWVLKVTDDINVAISQYEMNHIDESSELIMIPKAPAWCNHVMLWKNQILPVMDFKEAYDNNNQSQKVKTKKIMVAIVRVFNNSENKVSYGAIRILQPPILENIFDNQASKKQDIDQRWNKVSLSAFQYQESVVPILDINALFGGTLKS